MKKLVVVSSVAFFWAALFLPSLALGAPSGSAPAQAAVTPAPASSSAPVTDRKTSLSFDNEVVEGMNGNSLDSAEDIGAQDGNGQRLYHKRQDYKKEIPVLVHEMGYSE